MKELKFRAWDNVMMYFTGGGLRFKNTDEHLELHSIKPDRYVIEQFIGIRDVRGNEIYEGDIIKLGIQKVRADGDNADFVGVIVYDDDDAQYYANTGKYKIPLSKAGYSYEIIGNRHEIPNCCQNY